ncbi:putative leader peptide [Streptomyces crystallinus]
MYSSARPEDRTEVADVSFVSHAVRLHSRPHIDLQRVAGSLCSA